jgi:hypothetical protein
MGGWMEGGGQPHSTKHKKGFLFFVLNLSNHHIGFYHTIGPPPNRKLLTFCAHNARAKGPKTFAGRRLKPNSASSRRVAARLAFALLALGAFEHFFVGRTRRPENLPIRKKGASIHSFRNGPPPPTTLPNMAAVAGFDKYQTFLVQKK